MKARHGFTLIEAMMTLAIVSSVALCAPALNGWFQRQGVTLAVAQLRADLHLARIMAIRQKRNCAIVLNQPAPNQYSNSLNRQSVDLAGYRGGVAFLEAGPDQSAAQTRITFNRQGMSTSAVEVNVFLADQERQAIYRVQVRGPGGISVARWQGGGWH